jgi:hypothetical protein
LKCCEGLGLGCIGAIVVMSTISGLSRLGPMKRKSKDTEGRQES